MNSTFVLLFASFVAVSAAHPAFQHHFHKIINSNKCTANCIKIVHDSELEISILKQANISGFLLDLDAICATIKNASECMSTCVHKSDNPFMLPSSVKICDEEAKKDVEKLKSCLENKGSIITKTCIDECGDYEEVNGQVQKMTMDMAPNPHDAEKAAKVLEKTSDACKILKCSSRCSVQEYNEECDDIANDLGAGDLIQSLIEGVLKATRSDLEKHDLVDVLAHSVPAECNYMYMPETLFNETKDELSQLVIEHMKSAAKTTDDKSTTEVPDQIHLLRHNVHHSISYTLSQLQNKLLQKQFYILEEQQRNLEIEKKKLDFELALLKKKGDAEGVQV